MHQTDELNIFPEKEINHGICDTLCLYRISATNASNFTALAFSELL